MASARLSAAGLGHSEYDLRPTAARTARCPDAYDTSQRMLQPSGMGLRVGAAHTYNQDLWSNDEGGPRLAALRAMDGG